MRNKDTVLVLSLASTFFLFTVMLVTLIIWLSTLSQAIATHQYVPVKGRLVYASSLGCLPARSGPPNLKIEYTYSPPNSNEVFTGSRVTAQDPVSRRCGLDWIAKQPGAITKENLWRPNGASDYSRIPSSELSNSERILTVYVDSKYPKMAVLEKGIVMHPLLAFKITLVFILLTMYAKAIQKYKFLSFSKTHFASQEEYVSDYNDNSEAIWGKYALLIIFGTFFSTIMIIRAIG